MYVSGFSFLQIAQSRCVGRAKIDGEVIHPRMENLNTSHIILHGLPVGGVFVFADIRAHHQSLGAMTQSRDRCLYPAVVKAQSVEEGLVADETKKSRLGIAGLGPGGQGTYLHKTKTQGEIPLAGAKWLPLQH